MMFDERTRTRDLPWPRRGSWVGYLEEKYPTLGDLRAARPADIRVIPQCSRSAVKHVQDMLDRFPLPKPNAVTLAAIAEAASGECEQFDSVAAMLADLDRDDQPKSVRHEIGDIMYPLYRRRNESAEMCLSRIVKAVAADDKTAEQKVEAIRVALIDHYHNQ